MPVGQREKSLRSSPAHNDSLTFVVSASCWSETPRCRRIRRRLGPKASRSLMAARVSSQEDYQSGRRGSASQPALRWTLSPGARAGRRRRRTVFLQDDYDSEGGVRGGLIEFLARRSLLGPHAA